MHRWLCLAVILAGCASGPPERSEYHRGTFTPPPPAPVRPGVGLPTYDPHVKPLPPQPQPKPGRLLPETPRTRREPGIWASDAPPTATVLVLGLPVPLTDDESRADPRSAHLRRCAAELVTLTAQMPGYRVEDLDAVLGARSRRCLAARAMVACMDHRYRKALDERARMTGAAFKASAGPVNTFAGATAEARRLERGMCHDDDMHQMTFSSTVKELVDAWQSTYGSAPWMAP